MASEAFSEYGSHAIIFDFILGKKSGVLAFQPGSRKLYFEDGHLVFAGSETAGEHFSDILVTMGVLDAETLAEVRREMPQGESMGRKLKELGLATPAQLAQALKQQITFVVDQVLTCAEGTVEVSEEPLTGRVPKLKIQILALMMRTISGMEPGGFLNQVPHEDLVVARPDFRDILAETPLPTNYDPLVDLLADGSRLSADGLSDQLGWENRLVDGLVYLLHRMGAVTYERPQATQGELFAPDPTDTTLPGDDEDDGLDVTVLDHENPLDLSIHEAPEDDADLSLAGDLDDEDALERSLDIDDADEDAEELDFEADLGTDFNARFEEDEPDDARLSGPPTDLLAAALEDPDEDDDIDLGADDTPDEDDDIDLVSDDTPDEDDDIDLGADEAESFSLDDLDDEASEHAEDAFSFNDEGADQTPAADDADDERFASFDDDASTPDADLDSDTGDLEEDDVDLDAMDQAAMALEEEGYDDLSSLDAAAEEAEAEQLDFGGASMDDGLETTAAVGTFDMDDSALDAPLSGEFSADDLTMHQEDDAPSTAAFAYDEPAADTALSYEEPAADTAFSYEEPEQPTYDSSPILPDPHTEDEGSGLYQPHGKSRAPLFIGLLALVAVAALAYWFFMIKPSPAPAASDRMAADSAHNPADTDPTGSNDGDLESENVTEDGSETATENTASSEPDTPETTAADDGAVADTPTARDTRTAEVPAPPRETTNRPTTSHPDTTSTDAPSFDGDIARYAQDSVARFKAGGEAYSVALMLACSEETVQEFLQANAGENIFVFPREYEGRACFTIAWGAFHAYSDAVAARASDMPASLQRIEGSWVKNFKSFL